MINTRGPYQSPVHDRDTHPSRWYLDGILANYVNPLFGLVTRPVGGLGMGASGHPDTHINPLSEWDNNAPMPGTRPNPYDPLPNLSVHPSSLIDTSQPRTAEGMQAVESYQVPAPMVNGGGVSGYVDRAASFFAQSPVAAIFLGIAALLAFNTLIFRSGRVDRAGRRTGAAVAGIGTATAAGATGAGNSVVDAANKAAASVVEAAEGATS